MRRFTSSSEYIVPCQHIHPVCAFAEPPHWEMFSSKRDIFQKPLCLYLLCFDVISCFVTPKVPTYPDKISEPPLQGVTHIVTTAAPLQWLLFDQAAYGH